MPTKASKGPCDLAYSIASRNELSVGSTLTVVNTLKFTFKKIKEGEKGEKRKTKISKNHKM